ncbi:MAG: division/cell wall cluster transcriptional repressor MraZ [Acidobacteria bacterium]|nr:division/cell wall cluster transcriptional repressor MraZ [Acidobacteriota bacterium]
MLRGNHPATVDAKSRIKVPTAFRNVIRETYGDDLFVTSFSGDNVLAYPMSEWNRMEERLQRIPSMNPARQKLMTRVNYFGAVASMDRQGRILVPQLLRESARVDGEVVVMGQISHLEIWNHDTFRGRLDDAPLTDDDLQVLADMGI